jgi:hypothetical protein
MADFSLRHFDKRFGCLVAHAIMSIGSRKSDYTDYVSQPEDLDK